MSKQEALEQIVSLAQTHGITADEIAGRLTHTKSATQQTGILKKLLTYIGGLFVFAGLGLLVEMLWDDMVSLQRVICTLGIGMTAYTLGLLTHRDPRFEKAATPLFLIGALLQPGGLVVFLREYIPEGGDAQLAMMLIFGTMLLQHGIALWATKRPSLAFLSLVFWNAFLGTSMDKIDIDEELIGLCMGISTLLLTFNGDKKGLHAITPFWYFVGGGLTLASYWGLVEGEFLDITYLGVNAFFVYLSIRLASRSLLFLSVIGLLGYLSYFTYEYFKDITGWPVALIVMGLVMMGLSAYAVKLSQQIKTSRN